ncbi:unnamed protein product, partial [Didymodactylos carnosus]
HNMMMFSYYFTVILLLFSGIRFNLPLASASNNRGTCSGGSSGTSGSSAQTESSCGDGCGCQCSGGDNPFTCLGGSCTDSSCLSRCITAKTCSSGQTVKGQCQQTGTAKLLGK